MVLHPIAHDAAPSHAHAILFRYLPVHFRDVVICDNSRCGAILRISDRPGPITVALQQGAFGTFIVCPRCAESTLIDPAAASESVDAERPAGPLA